MALINVRRLILEEISPVTNRPIPTSQKFIIDCNEYFDIEPFGVNSEERFYTNDNQTVNYNLSLNRNQGYDITIGFSSFDLSLYSFLSSNVFINEISLQSNLFGNANHLYGNTISYSTTAYQVENSKIWGIQHIRPSDYGIGMYNTFVNGRYGILQSTAQAENEFIGYWSIYNNTATPAIRGTNEQRKYIVFDTNRNPDTTFMNSLKAIRDGIENGTIANNNDSISYTIQNGAYIMYTSIVGGFNATSSYILEETTTVPVNNLVGFYQFGIMQSYSFMAMCGTSTAPGDNWRPQSVVGITYNFLCVLESSNLVIKYNFDDTRTRNYDIAEFYYQMAQLPAEYKADEILSNTYMYITFNNMAREMVNAFSTANPRAVYTQDATVAAQNYSTVMNFVNDDNEVVLFDNLLNLRSFFVGSTTELDPSSNNTSWVLRRSMTFSEQHDIKMSSFIFFMPTSDASNPWVPPTDQTPPVLRMGIPFKSPTWCTLVPRYYPLELQPAVIRAYGENEQEQYTSDMQEYIGSEYVDDSEKLKIGGMKATHSTFKNNPKLFKTIMYTERYTGTDKTGYYKMEFPVCYSDPPPININNVDFTQQTTVIHAREDFIDNISSLYVNPVDNLEE